ncbi:Cellular retinaldehyde binding/alpha-tocopherol transport [Penicillium odoratum]|uniref:Cellular retinaldehyde binding/alpha-tocopherol transport n=1 Tax=Penicillium odoratum TaxID=1167516 RepID=UPI0025479CBA|nr:Cellular retinaldehyde binding/alpha-tocopherol transport [Penicillium odoratum]KAJ5760819.1 Cellular retinaldehyde binding/alpha-tocopherol transport [Penicillium odoratum]
MAAAAEKMSPTDPKFDQYDFPTTAPEAQSGHPGHTTPEQDEKVVKLRAELLEEGYTERLDTLSLLRFLRARKFDIAAAKLMFTNCEKWRKTFGTDELPAVFDYKEKADVFKFYPQYYHKTDKDGRPVYIEKLGKIDLDKMYKITTGERMLQNLVTEYEKLADPRLPACSRKAGKLLETCCTIMDLKGVGVTSIPSVYGYVRQASDISQNYYPERLGKLYIINAPWGFSSAFSFVKGFLDPVTVNKIHVLGSGYQKELLSQIPKENLPVEFGGSCNCEGGCELSDMGPWQESEWVRPPAWAAPKEAPKEEAPAAVIENEDPGYEKKDAEGQEGAVASA